MFLILFQKLAIIVSIILEIVSAQSWFGRQQNVPVQSKRMSCEESDIFFESTAYISPILEKNHGIFLHTYFQQKMG